MTQKNCKTRLILVYCITRKPCIKIQLPELQVCNTVFCSVTNTDMPTFENQKEESLTTNTGV